MNKLAALVILVSLSIGVSPFALDHYLIKEESFSFPAKGKAINTTADEVLKLGVVTNSNLDYGRVPVDAAIIKFFNISAPKKTVLEMDASGNISGALDFKDTHKFKGRREIRVAFNATQPGYYAGNVSIKSYTARNKWGSAWLDIKTFY